MNIVSGPVSIMQKSSPDIRHSRLFELIRQQNVARGIAERMDNFSVLPLEPALVFARQSAQTLRRER